jgi:hypothetical protein
MQVGYSRVAPFFMVLCQVDPPAPAAEEPGDSWEDKADMSSAATTPDDEDNSMEDDSGECWAALCFIAPFFLCHH